MSFPVYRKYSNGLSHFKIRSETRFTEIKLLGSKAERYEFEAKIFPDRQLIQDMIEMTGGFWSESSKKEYSEVIAMTKTRDQPEP